MVMEWFPAPSAKLPLEMFGSARAGTGSSPASAFPIGVEVVPRETPKSNTSNWSPAVNASVTVKVVPPAGATKVQGGASRDTLGVPELGVPDGPAGWLGARRGGRGEGAGGGVQDRAGRAGAGDAERAGRGVGVEAGGGDAGGREPELEPGVERDGSRRRRRGHEEEEPESAQPPPEHSQEDGRRTRHGSTPSSSKV